MSDPFFSIITASYNSESTIAATLQSVLSMEFTDYEYWVVDGGSTDNTVAILRSFEVLFRKKGIAFCWLSESDKGIYDAWNKGIKRARGHWVSFLGSDDLYLPNALSLYQKEILLHPDCNYACSQVELIDSQHQILGVIGKPFIFKNILKDMDIAQVGSFHKRELFEQIGLFDLHYRIVGDLDFYLRCKDIIKPHFFPKITAQMGNGGVSNQLHKALMERLEATLKYNYQPAWRTYMNVYWSLVKSYIKVLIGRK